MDFLALFSLVEGTLAFEYEGIFSLEWLPSETRNVRA